MKLKRMGRIPICTGMFLLFLSAGLGSCKDDDAGSTSGYDPSRPVVFTGFSPDEGSLRTEFYIQGENFGTDPTKVHVTIGGQTANTIGCNGHEIYCMVPRRAFDGTVRVRIESSNGRETVDYEFEKKFNIEIPDDAAEKISTVGEAIDYIEEHTK